MAKPDAALLDPARYPFRCTLEPRFGDLDVNMHVNNAAFTQMLEDARVRFHRESGFVAALAGGTGMVASLAIEYLGQTYYPDPLRIHVAPSRIGRTSYTLAQLVIQRDTPVAYAQAIMVCVGENGPAEIPSAFRESARSFMLRE